MNAESCGKAVTSCPSCLFSHSLQDKPDSSHSVLPVASAGPYLLHMQLGQKSAQVGTAGCSAPARFDGRNEASPGPFLVSAGPQQARISDLFQSQKINYQLRKNFQVNTKLCLPWEDAGWDQFSSLGGNACLGDIFALYYHANEHSLSTELAKITLIRTQRIQTHCGFQEG